MQDDAAAKGAGEKTPAPHAGMQPRQWTSNELLEGHAEAIIIHAGEVYRLRRTRNNKLILTK